MKKQANLSLSVDVTDVQAHVENFKTNVLRLGDTSSFARARLVAVLLSLACGRRQRSNPIRNGTFGARLDRVTGISVAPEDRGRYVEPFLDRYHGEEKLVQKAGPQASVPPTRKHRDD